MPSLPPNEILASVIVPAFNVEPYIEECLRSLFNQTLDRLEIIVVDDGSTDGTRTVVESLKPPQGKTVKVISKPNGGLSSARNAGLKAARGRWIGFVDADDWVARDMFSLLISEAESGGAEIAIARNLRVNPILGVEEQPHDILRWNKFIASHGRRVYPLSCPDLFVLDQSACRRVYSHAFLQRIEFEFVDGVLFEDFIANFHLLLRTSVVVLVDEPLYFYRIGHHGQITGRKDAKVLDILVVLNKIIDELQSHSASSELWANFVFFQGWNVIWLISQVADEHKEKLASGAIAMARRFPPGGLVRFRRKFGTEPKLATVVELQLNGNANFLVEYVRTWVLPEPAKKAVGSNIRRLLFVARAQLTSRPSRSQRRWGRTSANAH